MWRKSAPKVITILYPYRAFHNQAFDLKVTLFFLLPIAFNIILLLCLNELAIFWSDVYTFFLAKLGYQNAVAYAPHQILGFSFMLPYIALPSVAPAGATWLGTLIFSVVLLILSFMMTDTYTPLKYFLRALVFLLMTALIYFFITPTTFPYDIAMYTEMGLLQILALMFTTPWIFGFTYYLFSYKCLKKILVTLILLIFLAVFAAFQYLLSAYLLSVFSYLLMPALYIFFGLLVDIFIIVAFYAYGVSLEQVFPQKEAI